MSDPPLAPSTGIWGFPWLIGLLMPPTVVGVTGGPLSLSLAPHYARRSDDGERFSHPTNPGPPADHLLHADVADVVSDNKSEGA